MSAHLRGCQTSYLFLTVSLLPTSAPLRPSTPEKFSVPHICARFGPGGFLIKVLPNLPSEGQPALVEIHSMEVKSQRKKGGGSRRVIFFGRGEGNLDP